jgi:hypothetical protein
MRTTLAASMLAACCWMLPACWLGGDLVDGEDSGDGDGGTDTAAPFEDVACGDLSPCVVSDLSGYTCPGAPLGVECWDLAAHCDASYLCASMTQACIIACAQASCSKTGGVLSKPVCD